MEPVAQHVEFTAKIERFPEKKPCRNEETAAGLKVHPALVMFRVLFTNPNRAKSFLH
jgi:hypothetical protein